MTDSKSEPDVFWKTLDMFCLLPQYEKISFLLKIDPNFKNTIDVIKETQFN